MREIKFRAWHKEENDDGEMLTMNMQYAIGDQKTIIDDSWTRFWEALYRLQENRNITLMQYTGLKDKNGKEIYEGDIVNPKWESFYKNKYWYVGFDYGQFVLINDMGRKFGLNLEWEEENQTDWEAIGNIYENPELLEGDK